MNQYLDPPQRSLKQKDNGTQFLFVSGRKSQLAIRILGHDIEIIGTDQPRMKARYGLRIAVPKMFRLPVLRYDSRNQPTLLNQAYPMPGPIDSFHGQSSIRPHIPRPSGEWRP